MDQRVRTIGVDLGGTKIKVAVVDETGTILRKTRVATPTEGGSEAVIREIVRAVRELQGADAERPEALGIGVAGQVGPAGDTVRFAPNLGWLDVPLKAALQTQLDLPVALLNDVRAATWGEWLFGAGRDCENLICLFIGTGIGGGLVCGGRVLDGSSNSAGEVGHVTVDLHGPPCTCGNRGCLEALAGGWAIARRAREAVAADPRAGAGLKKLADEQNEPITAKLVARAAHRGDPLAGQIVAEVLEALVAGAVGLVNAFNPRRLILGGGVIEGLPELVGQIDLGIRTRALKAAWEGLQVLPAQLGNDAGVIGGAAFARRSFSLKGEPS